MAKRVLTALIQKIRPRLKAIPNSTSSTRASPACSCGCPSVAPKLLFMPTAMVGETVPSHPWYVAGHATRPRPEGLASRSRRLLLLVRPARAGCCRSATASLAVAEEWLKRDQAGRSQGEVKRILD